MNNTWNKHKFTIAKRISFSNNRITLILTCLHFPSFHLQLFSFVSASFLVSRPLGVRHSRLHSLRGGVPRSSSTPGSRRKGGRHTGSGSRQGSSPSSSRSRSCQSCSTRLRRLFRWKIRRLQRQLRSRGSEHLPRSARTLGSRRKSNRHTGSGARQGCAFGSSR